MCRASWSGCVASGLLHVVIVSCGASTPQAPWVVLAVRERTADEIPFEERTRYLLPPLDANTVTGPDSLRALVQIDEEHHPHLYLEDQRTGATTPLLAGWASLPHWSPDGRYISCVVWKSPRQPHELTVIDVPARQVILDPDVEASGAMMKWSPDSRSLVASGVMYGRPRPLLYTLTVPDGSVRVLDSLTILSEYDFSWSPDARFIAFSRPTALDEREDPIASDLWIADVATAQKWLVLETAEWIEATPLWITDRAIQVDQAHWDGAHRGVERRRVIELSFIGGP
jgi:hypothetical protein